MSLCFNKNFAYEVKHVTFIFLVLAYFVEHNNFQFHQFLYN